MSTSQLEQPGRQTLIHVGKVVARLREARGWNAAAFAVKADVPVSWLAFVEEHGNVRTRTAMEGQYKLRVVRVLGDSKLSECDKKLLNEWVGHKEIPSLREGVEAASAPVGPGGGAQDGTAAGTDCNVGTQDGGRTGKPAGSAVPYGPRVTAGVAAAGEPDRELINRIWMQSIDRDGAGYRSWRGLVLENAISTLEERCQVTTAVAHGGVAGASKVILRDSVAIGALLEERGWDLVDLEMTSIVPVDTCRAAQNREAVEVGLLDRMIVAIDEAKPLRPSQWIDYLTQTFAIDGWNPDRCLRLLSRAGFVTGVRG